MKKLLTLVAFSVLLLGTTWYTTNAYADDLFPPVWRGSENSYLAEWTDLDPVPDSSNLPPDSVSQGQSSFDLFDLDDFFNNPSAGSLAFCNDDGNGACVFTLPNFIDDLEKKWVRVQVTYTGDAPGDGSMIANDNGGQGGFDDCTNLVRQEPNAGFYYEDFECLPNPDLEQYTTTLPQGTQVTQIVVDTISFDGDEPPLPPSRPVGGELIPLDTTGLLVAGAQMNAAWMIPVIVSGIGFAIVIARKF